MNTLKISQIFSQISYYQNSYLNIIADPIQYFTIVEEAVVSVWPFKAQQLYLGDLLQLWFSEKWCIEPQNGFELEDLIHTPKSQHATEKSYIYSIQGNIFTGRNQIEAWSLKNQHVDLFTAQQLIKFYTEFKALCQPVLKCNQAHSAYKFVG